MMGVNANISESLTGTIEAPFPEFEAPPANPMEVLRNWLERARRYARAAGTGLATVDGQGRPSTRIVVIAELGERGWCSPPTPIARRAANWRRTLGLGVLYWRESSQQIILNGRAERLPDERADAQWLSRPYQTHPMSIASRQSETLADIHALRAEARRLAETEPAAPAGLLPVRTVPGVGGVLGQRHRAAARAPALRPRRRRLEAPLPATVTTPLRRRFTADMRPRPRSRRANNATGVIRRCAGVSWRITASGYSPRGLEAHPFHGG